MAETLVNGLPARTLDAGDRGFMYGDGVFRTLAVHAGRPINWATHYRLLCEDCARLGLPVPVEAVLRHEVARVAPADAAVKIVLTRGPSARGYAYPTDIAPTRLVVAYPPREDDPQARTVGVRVRRCRVALALQPALAGVKSLNRLENVLARAEWQDPQVREGLLADTEGRLVEGTMSNVFLVREGALVTPDLSRCGVRGSQRERVLALARKAGLACQVRDTSFAELEAADEAFLTNSLIGIWPVAAFEARTWLPGPVTRRLQDRLDEADARDA